MIPPGYPLNDDEEEDDEIQYTPSYRSVTNNRGVCLRGITKGTRTVPYQLCIAQDL